MYSMKSWFNWQRLRMETPQSLAAFLFFHWDYWLGAKLFNTLRPMPGPLPVFLSSCATIDKTKFNLDILEPLLAARNFFRTLPPFSRLSYFCNTMNIERNTLALCSHDQGWTVGWLQSTVLSASRILSVYDGDNLISSLPWGGAKGGQSYFNDL